MNETIPRRAFMSHTLGTLLVAPLAACSPAATAHPDSPATRAIGHLSHLAPPGVRLGVAVLDTETSALFGQSLDEPFAMCSTFKLPLAAMVLRAADRGELSLDDKLTYTKSDIVPHAPVTEQHLEAGFMTIGELTRAAQVTSDNVAANLLLRRLGGLENFTAFCRELGDTSTRLDDYEPMMNLVPAGSTHNTSTPRAMARLVSKLVSDGFLSHPSLKLLQDWMLETTTGKKRLRAGFPKSWKAGDKTGTNLGKGMLSCYNDIGVVWFEGRAPLIVVSFLESPVESENMRDEDQAILARVGYVVSHWAETAVSPRDTAPTAP
jgi:beta-lactamase class A